MSTKKGRGNKVAPVKPVGNQKTFSLDSDIQSTFDSTIFIEGLQQENDNPLHSTAIEEDLNTSEKAQVTKTRMRKNLTQRAKEKVKTRPLKNDQPKIEKKKRDRDRRRPSDSQYLHCDFPAALAMMLPNLCPQAESVSRSSSKKRGNEVLSSGDDTNEDTSWPSPKKAKLLSVERTKNKSTGEKVVTDKKKQRFQGGTELEVVLEAFRDFCDEYRDSLESKAAKHTIDCFSNNVKEQLLEKISTYKELKVLKRNNAKVCSIIHTKTQRLFNAKDELISAERQLDLLQNEKTDLELRLQDLRRSQAFLQDIRELNQVYLDYRLAHPKEKETYAVSSLPALLLETKHLQGAEHQLRLINNKLERKLRGNGK
ncbi:centromere protein U isoform X1 [Syngnathoides biaculeatus]|uniref:centromere protein U isoform X1 n=1 Tax=Syngnathoides biaculeatus TaxID=300417 RepID=UPI002ADDAEDE|nr:centromere protein U isoform X1 [Syngnathoides biaculeatus]